VHIWENNVDYVNFREYLIAEGVGKLNVAALENRAWRVDLFKKKIDDKSLFKLNNGTDVQLKKDKSYNYLSTDLAGFGTNKPKHTFRTIDNIELRLSAFAKSAEFGGIGVATKSPDKTSLQEVGLLIMLDSLIATGNTDLHNYTASSKMHVKANLNDVVAFLLENKDWFKVAADGAKVILKEFNFIRSGYNFHHDSTEFNAIRTLGKKLAKASSPDKWNPSDIYLIKDYETGFTDIFNYNDYISDNTKIIGISLKKGEKDAMHGSFSLMNTAAHFNLNYKKNTYKSLDDAKPAILKLFKSLKHHSIAYYAKYGTSENLEEIVETLAPDSVNYLLSIMPQLAFFNSVKSTEELHKILKFAILTSMSISPLSAPHYKLEGTKFSHIPSGSKSIRIDEVILPLNSDANSLIKFRFHNKDMLVSLRSKGAQPQFSILKKGYSAPIKLMKSFK